MIFVKFFVEKTEGLLNAELFSHDLSTDVKIINNHTAT
jgi:hypothetical protein